MNNFKMKCQKCGIELPESEIQVSHDVPQYIGGTDKNGRHNLCKKCHDIYERIVFSVMVKPLVEGIKQVMRIRAEEFAKSYFKEEKKDGGSSTI